MRSPLRATSEEPEGAMDELRMKGKDSIGVVESKHLMMGLGVRIEELITSISKNCKT